MSLEEELKKGLVREIKVTQFDLFGQHEITTVKIPKINLEIIGKSIGYYDDYIEGGDPLGKEYFLELIEITGLSEYDLNKFHKDLRIFERIYLLKHGITNEIANSYCPLPITDNDETFVLEIHGISRAKAIEFFHENNISPEEASEIIDGYDDRFSDLTCRMIVEGFSSKVANAYPERFNEWEIHTLWGDGKTPGEVKLFPDNFKATDFTTLNYAGVNSKNYSKEEIRRLGEIFKLIGNSFPEEIIEKEISIIGTGVNGVVISWKEYAIKFSKEIQYEAELLKKVKAENKELNHVIQIMEDTHMPFYSEDYLKFIRRRDEILREEYGLTDIEERYENRSILEEYEDWGIGDEEEEFIAKIEDDLMEEGHTFASKHHPASELEKQRDKLYIWLERISGETLETMLKKESLLISPFSYGYDILQGIQELRNAEIYHRDLHDRNIMIDEFGEAIIIDLGAATTNPNEVHEQNRLYGGNNDLISLGLLMYKMATGHNLFSDESGHSYREEIKDSIKTEREKTYEDPTLKK
ncbi:MAG: protein kinase family protein, partial [Nanoarchaeota archaeon]|nr:protein kinase family protein [Nanoarchaeota archaeon]